MSVVFAGETALKIYQRNPWLAGLPRCKLPDAGECSIVEALLMAAEFHADDSTPHIMVTKNAARRYSSGRIVCHLLSEQAQDMQYVCFRGCYLASPELCLAQLSRGRSFVELLRLACMFCGDYRPSEIRFKEGNQPLTSVCALEGFVAHDAGNAALKGIAAVRKVLPYIVENSHSARETQLALMLSLPCRLGGYGLPKPQMNASLKKSSREADLLWETMRLVVEYESNQHHASVEALGRDSARRAEIEMLGYHVITATNEQVTNLALMDDLARLVAKNLGRRVRVSDVLASRRCKLHRELFLSQLEI